MTFYAAGMDTTGHVLGFIFFMLGKHPEVKVNYFKILTFN